MRPPDPRVQNFFELERTQAGNSFLQWQVSWIPWEKSETLRDSSFWAYALLVSAILIPLEEVTIPGSHQEGTQKYMLNESISLVFRVSGNTEWIRELCFNFSFWLFEWEICFYGVKISPSPTSLCFLSHPALFLEATSFSCILPLLVIGDKSNMYTYPFFSTFEKIQWHWDTNGNKLLFCTLLF